MAKPWDLVIVGGGITGAGILREAVRLGYRALLVEGRDFASGTSSRSSKLVHGGLRYLKNGQVRLTYESVRERERLLAEGRGLVTPLGFLMANYRGDSLPGWVFGMGLVMYDLLALQWGHRRYDAGALKALCPPLCETGLQGGYRYFDAQTDDARLVLRVIAEAVAHGGTALNYARACQLLRRGAGQVSGLVIADQAPGGGGRTAEVQAGLVINATGAWADGLRTQVGGRPRLRKLRGSHLIFPSRRLPLIRAVSLLHPADGRPVFAFPWEGVTVVGTTDVDHAPDLDAEPAISQQEADYLLQATVAAFPQAGLSLADVQTTFAGVRPVIDTGQRDPSKESREHVLWMENGLLTIAGGKLTTFRRMACDALRAARNWLPAARQDLAEARILDLCPVDNQAEMAVAGRVGRTRALRLNGRYGAAAAHLVAAAAPGELENIAGSPALWAELRWAARSEGVVHLDDLLLRRVRLGLLLPRGGLGWAAEIRRIVQPELGWDDRRWDEEISLYTDRWNQCYHLPL